MEQRAVENVNSCLNTNIYSYSETSDGQSSNQNLNVVHFLTPGLIRHLWQLKTVVSLHWCLISAGLLIICKTTGNLFLFLSTSFSNSVSPLFLPSININIQYL